jgi:aarF domain-containing kinase
MVFVDNFVHSDLHAGNILVRINHDSTHTGRIKQSAPRAQDANFTIYLLDAGIATQLTPRGRQNLKDLFKAVILNEGEKAGRLMVERARFERCSLIHGGVDAFSRGVGEIVSDFHDRRKAGLTLGVVRIGALLAKVLDLCRVYGVEIDPAMANIVLSTLILEGLGRSLDENLNLIDCAIPFVLGRV